MSHTAPFIPPAASVGAGLPRTIRAMLRPFVLLLVAASCADEPTSATQTQTPPSASSANAVALAADSGTGVHGTLPLPVSQNFSSAGVALRITQTGAGPSANFVISNPASTAVFALQGNSNGLGAAVRGLMTGPGRAGLFEITNAGSTSNALHVVTSGIGRAVYGETSGRGGPAAEFVVSNGASLDPALRASTAGSGNAIEATSAGTGPTVLGINYGIGTAGQFDIRSGGNGSPALLANTDGSGAAMSATSTGSGVALTATNSGTGTAGLFRGHLRAEANNTTALSANVLTGAGYAGDFTVFTPTSSYSAIIATTYGTGRAGTFTTLNTSSSADALQVGNAGSGWAAVFSSTNSSGKGVLISTLGGQQALQVIGGSKNAVVGTSDGARALYTEESTEVWFTDYGFGRLENGRAHIALDPKFAETVSLDGSYHVFVQAYGDADVYVTRRTATGFEVVRRAGDKQVEFSYRVVARRKGFEARRLERAPWADDDPGLSPGSP